MKEEKKGAGDELYLKAQVENLTPLLKRHLNFIL